MKIILSRKGFDSQYGGMPSPILPDGTLLSLPIPSKIDINTKFTDIHWDNKSYYDIIKELNPKTKIKESYYCHLDPDIRRSVIRREKDWIPAFGQEKAALGHLNHQGVGIGDIFLFFGWFRQTEYINSRLSYKIGAPDWHVIYGYLQIGEIIKSQDKIPTWLKTHPHAIEERWQHNNAIFIASKQLSIYPNMQGANCLNFSKKLVLTKENAKNRSYWELPNFFRKIPISYNLNAWESDYFASANRGQEFVFEANDNVIEWIKCLLSP